MLFFHVFCFSTAYGYIGVHPAGERASHLALRHVVVFDVNYCRLCMVVTSDSIAKLKNTVIYRSTIVLKSVVVNFKQEHLMKCQKQCLVEITMPSAIFERFIATLNFI